MIQLHKLDDLPPSLRKMVQPKTIVDKVKSIFRKHEDTEIDVEDVHLYLWSIFRTEVKEHTLYETLYLLAKKNYIKRLSQGVYTRTSDMTLLEELIRENS